MQHEQSKKEKTGSLVSFCTCEDGELYSKLTANAPIVLAPRTHSNSNHQEWVSQWPVLIQTTVLDLHLWAYTSYTYSPILNTTVCFYHFISVQGPNLLYIYVKKKYIRRLENFIIQHVLIQLCLLSLTDFYICDWEVLWWRQTDSSLMYLQILTAPVAAAAHRHAVTFGQLSTSAEEPQTDAKMSEMSQQMFFKVSKVLGFFLHVTCLHANTSTLNSALCNHHL